MISPCVTSLLTMEQLTNKSHVLQRMPDGDGRKPAKEGGDFWWDVAGWVTLIGLGVGVFTMSKNSAAAVAPPPMPMQ